MEETINQAAAASRERLREAGLAFGHIFAKIYDYKSKMVLTDKHMCSNPVVYVRIPPPILVGLLPGAYRNVTSKISPMLSPAYTLHSHLISHINIGGLIEKRVIYSRVSIDGDLDSDNNPIPVGTIEYWYKVQDRDILSGFIPEHNKEIHGPGGNQINDDVARGYIRLVDRGELGNFITVTNVDEICKPKQEAGNKCTNKRKKKHTKHIIRHRRRRSKTRRRNIRN